MLYDERVKAEIDQELEYILSQNHHYLSGTEEETQEELRQARGVAHNIVMQRQEKDLLDMLYEWRELKSLICEADVLSTEQNKLLQEAKSLPKINEGASLEDCRAASSSLRADSLSAFNRARDFQQRAYAFSCKAGGYILAMKDPKK